MVNILILMKRTFISLTLFFLLSFFVTAQCRLEIEIVGLKNNTGLIMLQLLDENEKVVDQAKGRISGQKSLIVFRNLKPGKYAFRYYHDENLSEIMETGFMGKPKEGYGFSNNAAGPFGPKPFKDWLFELKGDMKVTVSARY